MSGMSRSQAPAAPATWRRRQWSGCGTRCGFATDGFSGVRDPRVTDQQQSSFESSPDAYRVRLDSFEGPLDLLIHLIRKNEVNIYDIPLALITEQYLGFIELMQELDLDVAGEFLVMAATLIHIKSRTLLPRADPLQDDGQSEEDPREALVRRLLEHQKY